jgi:hypothetical protein
MYFQSWCFLLCTQSYHGSTAPAVIANGGCWQSVNTWLGYKNLSPFVYIWTLKIWSLRGRRRYYRIGCLMTYLFCYNFKINDISYHFIWITADLTNSVITVASLFHLCLIFAVWVRWRQQICVEKDGSKDVAAVTKRFSEVMHTERNISKRTT